MTSPGALLLCIILCASRHGIYSLFARRDEVTLHCSAQVELKHEIWTAAGVDHIRLQPVFLGSCHWLSEWMGLWMSLARVASGCGSSVGTNWLASLPTLCPTWLCVAYACVQRATLWREALDAPGVWCSLTLSSSLFLSLSLSPALSLFQCSTKNSLALVMPSLHLSACSLLSYSTILSCWMPFRGKAHCPRMFALDMTHVEYMWQLLQLCLSIQAGLTP